MMSAVCLAADGEAGINREDSCKGVLLHLFYSADIVTCRYGHLVDAANIISLQGTGRYSIS